MPAQKTSLVGQILDTTGNVTTISLHQLTSALIAKPPLFNSKGLIGLMVMDRYKSEIFQELDISSLEIDKKIRENKTKGG